MSFVPIPLATLLINANLSSILILKSPPTTMLKSKMYPKPQPQPNLSIWTSSESYKKQKPGPSQTPPTSQWTAHLSSSPCKWKLALNLSLSGTSTTKATKAQGRREAHTFSDRPVIRQNNTRVSRKYTQSKARKHLSSYWKARPLWQSCISLAGKITLKTTVSRSKHGSTASPSTTTSARKSA